MNRVLDLKLKHDELFQGKLAEMIPYHRMYGKSYCLPSLTLYQPEEWDYLRSASERINLIYWKALRFTQRYLPDSFLTGPLGLHPSMVEASRLEVPSHGISRQDWIIGPNGMKCIENNTDTPTGVPETAILEKRLVEGFTPYTSISGEMRNSIQSAFRRLIGYYSEQGLAGTIAFSCYDWHMEDTVNTRYIMDAVAELGYSVMFVPLERLEIIPGEGLYAYGRRIHMLYRLYPLEYLIQDTDEASGLHVGEALMDLVVQGRLGLINPAQSIIMQSKGFMALIWSLFERSDITEQYCGFTLFEPEELETISTYLLPTYYEKTVFEQANKPYVAKAYWGREGKGTAVYNGRGTLEEAEWGHDEEEAAEVIDYYGNQPKIYQECWPMEEVNIRTESGETNGFLLTGVYVIGGACSGLLPRIGGKITGDMAYYCPAALAIKREGKN
ncbi:glutathionylspermidine synthase family protein [Paenibacillus sp. sptzw28]|uniref:glutathionylspermidine synthase family protein n=1 Tax=Paenibacillus sp. sptzw28 TaxID=715179 RepID=UPI001C6DF415|nr:glutathionylspermidine synthase family protein [Paenibacillus sp. sptzw28]QYR23618.1 glutathionylspermidine synthase family protein [Paenibacillus sp. sptzw28]